MKKMIFTAAANPNGSVIVIALLMLVLLTIAGISGIKMAVTESYIVRNTAIHKQNLQLAEIAAREGLQRIVNLDDAAALTPDSGASADWLLRRRDDPEDDGDGLAALEPGHKVAVAETVTENEVLKQRGENGEVLSYYFVGWETRPGGSLKMTDTRWRLGKVVGVYNSENYGRAAVELGVTKRF